MTQGFCMATGVKVCAITAPPVSPATHKDKFFFARPDEDENANYRYLPVLNLPVIKLFFQVVLSFFACAWQCLGKEKTYVICDMLCGSAAIGAKAAAKLFRRKFTGIITDIPDYLGQGDKISLLDRLLKRQMCSCDSYVLLTETMNGVVNLKAQPYCVIEGQADSYAGDCRPVEKSSPRFSMYAGAVEQIYGLDLLAKAFSQLPEEMGVLEIYGNGNYVQQLKAFCETHPNVRYMGLLPNEKIVERERQAMLLINPRPSEAEYTKYSFPSKTMEYLASGTPALTTRLPGIPKEYDAYLYFIDDESENGIRKALEKVLSLPGETLIARGKAGQTWVLKEKNSQRQVQRILDMWESMKE